MTETKKLSGFQKTISGTIVFDFYQAQRGRRLNAFFMTLNSMENRERFKRDERRYAHRFGLSPDETAAMLSRDYNTMLEMGGNIYFISKLIAIDGKTFQQIAADMSGMDEHDFKTMMLNGGRSPKAL